MTETRDMTLGGRTFAVPRLPIGHNIEAYPLLRRLHNAGLAVRWFAEGPTNDEMADLASVLFICAKAAEPALTTDDYYKLPITPAEMWDAYSVAKFQSGGWVPLEAGADLGEGKGEPRPPTSTSAESSPS